MNPLVLLSGRKPSAAAIAYLQAFDGGEPADGAELWNASISVPAETDMFVVCVSGHYGTDANRRVDSITLGGQALTSGAESHNDSDNISALIYYLADPPTGTQTIVVTMVGTVASMGASGHAFSGVSGVGTNYTRTTQDTNFPAGPNITVSEGSWIIGCVTTSAAAGHGPEHLAVNAGDQRHERDMGAPIIGTATSGVLSAGSQTTPTWTDSNPSSAYVTYAGLELQI